ncbi:YfdX family protein [Komagataeibacter sp. FNDCR2]|uniref:YfdX family protein n=1 Tax=Komagataeibacter sp. FNDCR2 TaxID=2878682 RepID=UPI001E33BEC5|nr:YfdX family protein [Komagataeibacter sp. FNDCR2]MCE2574428.1 YfdX family protein [Komagataeibacter sp. FNDCR2]
MRFIASLAVMTGLLAAPLGAQAASLHTDWEKFKAVRAFNHLSSDGQRTMADILNAKQVLDAGQTDAAIPALYDAGKRLSAAGKANGQFIAAESSLQPAPQHPVAPTHVASSTPVTWIPVGGEVIGSETLAPEKKAAIATANTQLKSGNIPQAAQTMQVVGADAVFILALAPLEQTQGAINRATVFTEARNPKEASAALQQALDGIVFVSDDFVATMPPAPGAKQPAAKK